MELIVEVILVGNETCQIHTPVALKIRRFTGHDGPTAVYHAGNPATSQQVLPTTFPTMVNTVYAPRNGRITAINDV